MSKLIKSALTTIYFCLVFCLFQYVTVAQTKINATIPDIKANPTLWAKLKENFDNEDLWVQYFGTDHFNLTDEQTNYINVWRKKFRDEYNATMEDIEMKKIAIKHAGAPGIVSEKEKEYSNLIKNINQNFMVIEDYFNEEFANVGAKYTFYKDKHPDGAMDKSKWVEAQEKTLATLKAQQKNKK